MGPSLQLFNNDHENTYALFFLLVLFCLVAVLVYLAGAGEGGEGPFGDHFRNILKIFLCIYIYCCIYLYIYVFLDLFIYLFRDLFIYIDRHLFICIRETTEAHSGRIHTFGRPPNLVL